MVLPNFLIVGAAKSGTTSIYKYLAQHPEIFMSPVKELSYFKPPGALRGKTRFHVRTLDEYARYFAGVEHERAIGEATPAYLTSAAAARQIRETIPHARLIAILRQPADRAFSEYAMWVAQGYEQLSFADAIARELAHPDDVRRRYVRYGFYARQLSVYYELFEPSQIRICFYDDLEADPIELLRDLYMYLGVSPAFVPDLDRRHNARPGPPRHPVLNHALSLPSVKAVRRAVPRRARYVATRWARQRHDAPLECAPEERRFLTELFRDDIEHLERLTGRDLRSWLSS